MNQGEDLRRRTLIRAPKYTNGDRRLDGRIAVGPLTKHAERVTRRSTTEAMVGEGRGDRLEPAGRLLGERTVYLADENGTWTEVGVAYQRQRHGMRFDQYGQRQSGRGLPVEWEFAVPGRDYREYAHRSLAECLFTSITVMQGGMV